MENPKNCDWVTARASCEIEQTFSDLRQRIDDDLKTWNNLPSATGRAKITSSNGRECTIMCERNYDGFPELRNVFIRRTPKGITATVFKSDPVGQPQRVELFTATPILTDEGERKLKVVAEQQYDEPFQLLQVSRLALEELLFGEPE